MTVEQRFRKIRIPVLLLGVLAMVLGLWTGLQRLGWFLPSLEIPAVAHHGAIMVCGFLGTLISLERAVAVDLFWAYLAPVLTGLGTAFVSIGFLPNTGYLLVVLGSAGLIGIFAMLLFREFSLHMMTMTVATVCWWMGNILWAQDVPIHRVVLLWIGFLVLMILGERLELSRTLFLKKKYVYSFLANGLLFLGGLATSYLYPDYGFRVTGFAIVLMAIWSFRHDPARKTVSLSGLTRFMAVCLLAGYVWLLITGILLGIYGHVVAGPVYDAVLHGLFLGFVFSMIFAHAPVIFPAATGIDMAYSPVFYVHVLLLHVSLVLRVCGDLFEVYPLRKWGGMLNAVVLLLFVMASVYGMCKQGEIKKSALPSESV